MDAAHHSCISYAMLNLKDFVIRCNFAGTETGKKHSRRL